MQQCLSCFMPVSEISEPPEKTLYCSYCTDEAGELLPREQIQAGVAEWLKSLTPEDEETDYMKRADYYLKASPAWAED